MDEETAYRAVVARDRRFDGRFFTAVVTTGIYCRPICPARTPKRENVRFYPCAAAAEAAGFRACKRCRPDSAPGFAAWDGTSATVRRALRLIDDGALDEGDEETLAERLGIGARHLRRLFAEHVGAAPNLVAQTRRAHFARRLLDESELPIAQVAFAAGFASLRQFNDVMKKRFGGAPSELRKRRAEPTRGGGFVMRCSLRGPYEWAPMIAFLKARAIPGVERVDDDGYARVVPHGAIRVRGLTADRAGLEVEVDMDIAAASGEESLLVLIARVRRLFDLDADPRAIAARLGDLAGVRERPGLRVPGAFDPWEVAVRAIVGQQVSVAAATTLMGRIVARWGEPLPARRQAPGLTHLFPTREALAAAPLEKIGLPGARAEALRGLAASGLSFDNPGTLDELVERLCALPGVGPWTAHYLAMRGFGEPDAFPDGDLVLRKATGLDARRLRARAESWRPYRAYAALHIWTGGAEVT